MLKSEINTRKETEENFLKTVDVRTKAILDEYNIQYLNNLQDTREKIREFEHRRQKLIQKSEALKNKVDNELLKTKEELML